MIFTAEDVQSRLRSRPFVPLRIVTTTGQTYDIHHPDLVLPTRRFLEVGTPDRDNPTIPDTITRVALVHVAELQDLPATATPPA